MRKSTMSIKGLFLLSLIGMVAACAQGTHDEAAPVGAGGIDLGERLEWSSVDGAVEYRIQVWAQTRLLFEERREQTVLLITPSMERSLLGVRQAGMQVRAYAADGQMIGPVQRREFRSPDE